MAASNQALDQEDSKKILTSLNELIQLATIECKSSDENVKRVAPVLLKIGSSIINFYDKGIDYKQAKNSNN